MKFDLKFDVLKPGLACCMAAGLALASQSASAVVIAPDEDVMTSSFFSGANRVRGYPGDNRPVMRVSTDNPFSTAGAETIYLDFGSYDFSALGGPVTATLTMNSTAGGFNADAGPGNPFTVSAHGVNANPLTSITDDTNPGGPINWLDFYNNNILAANGAASTAVNCINCAVNFDVSALVNSWVNGANTFHAIALTGKNDTSGNDFLHGFLNNSDTSANQGFTFLTVTAVPEPESYAMLLAGLGLVALRLRRGRRG